MYRHPAPRVDDPDGEAEARRDALILRAEEHRQPFEPEVALFVDGSEQSEQARRMLEAVRIPFRTLAATGADIPAAAFGDMLFVGHANIGELIRTLKAIEAVFVTNHSRAHSQSPEAGVKRPKSGTNRTEQPTAARRAKTA